jgi:hypothetical protein
MKELADQIERNIQQDPGNRGLAHWALQNQILPAAASLLEGDHILLATGFYILRAGAIETDGPVGALILAHALVRAGKKVTLLFDDHSEDIFKAGLVHVDSSIDYVSLEVDKPIVPAELVMKNTTHMIALERPGRAKDRKYYNFAGKDITPYQASLDDLFIHCKNLGLTTIGVGDGGNELGMGAMADRIDNHTNTLFSCRTLADFSICAGVSNWGGYGLAALISRMYGKNFMPTFAVMNSILNDIVKAGAVDGISAKQETTVDGLDSTWERQIYEFQYGIANEILSPGNRNAC